MINIVRRTTDDSFIVYSAALNRELPNIEKSKMFTEPP